MLKNTLPERKGNFPEFGQGYPEFKSGSQFVEFGNMNALGFGGNGVEILLKLFEIPDLTQVSGGYFIGSGVQIQAAQTINPNDSLIMPASNTSIINALTLAGCYSQFYTTDSNPKTVLLSDIYLTNDQIIKSGNYLTLLPNPYQRNLISTLLTEKTLKRATVNLLHDPSFAEMSKISDRTTGEPVWWYRALPYSGANGEKLEFPNDTLLANGRKYFYAKLTSGTVGASPNVTLKQDFYFTGDVKSTDKISLSCYINTTGASRAYIAIVFLNRNNAEISGPYGTNAYHPGSGGLQQIKIENVSIPVDATGILGFRIKLATNQTGTVAYFTQPEVNIGTTAQDYENIYDEYEIYSGLERFIGKCIAGTAVNISLEGDSLTRNSDTTQTINTMPLAAFLKTEIPRLFGNAVTVRNNSADGSNHLLQHTILKKMSLDHNTDLTLLMTGRNTTNTSDEILAKYKVEETDIVRILTQSINNDIVVTLPFYQKLEPPISEDLQETYNKDLQFNAQNLALKTRYKVATIYSNIKIKAICDNENPTISWDLMYVDVNHFQQGGGHYIRVKEISYLIARALRYANNRPVINSAINQLLSLNPVTLYPSDFGVTEGTLKSGTWVNDANVTMNGTSYTASGVSLGEYDQPIVSSAQGDYLQVIWTGSHFGICFITNTNRGVAKITIDGTTYDVNTNAALSNSQFQIATFGKDSLNPGISLSEGSHTLKIEQKNATANDKISIALVTVF